ncbi:hypothetical protein [Helicobacter sp. 11S03491-1]|uniref:hypothetical protein n=1 Tax=Helicobacter sp. 11S03491-1 TaxID=1476196 RepID=UPI000BA77C2B|nr:hypothetical protein [Helicobacter sp. 11S03491-1]PAF42676.1 hypothetical protein BKH45_03975 [Helicobacter sp. 11S03491-1]
MKKITIVKLLEFFVGLFSGMSVFGSIACFLAFKDFSPLIALVLSLIFFAIFSFFGIVAKALSILLKADESKHV